MTRKPFFLIVLAFLFCASAEAKINGDYLESPQRRCLYGSAASPMARSA